MMDAAEKAADLLTELRSMATAERRDGMSRYFTTSMHCLGVAVPELRRVARAAARDFESETKASVLECSRHLLASNAFEARLLVYEIVPRHASTMASMRVGEIEELGSGNDNWGSVDAFAVLIAGVLWQRGRLADRTLIKWVRSDDLWWKRTAVVSAIPLNLKSRGGRGDTERTLRLVEEVKGDRRPALAKAVSWALRSLVPTDPDAVRRFLEANAEVLPRLVLRETRRKLETGRKSG